MEKYEIEISSDHEDGKNFVDWLTDQGHNAEIGNTTGNFIDGVWTNTDEKANQILNQLWKEYCYS